VSTFGSVTVSAHQAWLHAARSGAVDQSCQVSEVSRLLWTALVVAAATGVIAFLGPTWRRVAALVAAGLIWAWVDMEGPVLLTSGSHGLHQADLPVLVVLAAAGASTLRLVLRRRRTSI
jgi:hypothetical protein